MISYKQKLKLFKTLADEQKKGEDWLRRVPLEVNDAFFDNPYVDSLYKINSAFFEAVFTPQEQCDIEWWLDCGMEAAAKQHFVPSKGQFYDIGSFEDINEYITYLEKHCGWGEVNE